MIDTGNNRAKWLGERLRAATCKLFEHWADYRRGGDQPGGAVASHGPCATQDREFAAVRRVENGGRESARHVPGVVRTPAVVVDVPASREGVEPTNNAGERSLRQAVIWRKPLVPMQSVAGSRFVETMLTVIETCRQQCRSAFVFITAAVKARLTHQSAPPLLPGV